MAALTEVDPFMASAPLALFSLLRLFEFLLAHAGAISLCFFQSLSRPSVQFSCLGGGFLRPGLLSPHACIFAPEGDKFLVCTAFNHGTTREYQNLVGVHDRAKSMGDDEHCASFGERVE